MRTISFWHWRIRLHGPSPFLVDRPSSLSRPIIEGLYNEALILADEVRMVFALGASDTIAPADNMMRLALSSEGLKATTRMMHLLAWLLNQRAFLSGEMSELQLRKHGNLPPDRAPREEDVALLELPTRHLIDDTVHLHDRVARLDAAWREDLLMHSNVHEMRERIGRSLMQH